MPGVRVIKQTISTLLAVQLFVVFGLCGVVCCLPAQPESAQSLAQPHSHQALQADSHSDHQQNSEVSEAPSHCHSKPKKAPAAPRVEAAKAAHHCHGQKSGPAAAVTSAQICQCSGGQQSLPVLLTQSDSKQQKESQFSPGMLPVWQQAELSRPLPSASPPASLSHSPPFGGYQLSLRI